jgi:hypothetical protein
LPAHDVPPVVDDVDEALAQPADLVALAAVDGDALTVLAYPDQREAEISLEPLLVETEVDEGAPHEVGEPGAGDGVEQRDPDHVSRDGPVPATGVEFERARQAPQNHDEGAQRHDG